MYLRTSFILLVLVAFCVNSLAQESDEKQKNNQRPDPSIQAILELALKGKEEFQHNSGEIFKKIQQALPQKIEIPQGQPKTPQEKGNWPPKTIDDISEVFASSFNQNSGPIPGYAKILFAFIGTGFLIKSFWSAIRSFLMFLFWSLVLKSILQIFKSISGGIAHCLTCFTRGTKNQKIACAACLGLASIIAIYPSLLMRFTGYGAFFVSIQFIRLGKHCVMSPLTVNGTSEMFFWILLGIPSFCALLSQLPIGWGTPPGGGSLGSEISNLLCLSMGKSFFLICFTLTLVISWVGASTSIRSAFRQSSQEQAH